MSVNRVVLAAAAALLVAACSRSPEARVVRLVDVFDTANVEGSPKGEPVEPSALWDFSKPPAAGADPLLGWKAGPGVADLKVTNGKLTGRSTTDFPLVYVSRPKTVDPKDAFDSLEVKIEVSDGANLGASAGGAKPDFTQIIQMAKGLPWPFQSPVVKGRLQTVTLQSQQVSKMSWETLMFRPTDVPGATFAIETIQAIPQRERRAAIKSGVGWQGLDDIYQESLVSRSPEKVTMQVNVPANAWLDLNVGTVEDHPVTFKVAAVKNGSEEILMERTLTTPHRWEPAPVDLSTHSGSTTLRLWLDVPEERSIGFWGAPVIRSRGVQAPPQKVGAALGGVEAPQGVIIILCDTLRKDHLPMYGYMKCGLLFF